MDFGLILLTRSGWRRLEMALASQEHTMHCSVMKAGWFNSFVFQCEVWSQADGACHCNSHRKSVYWKILRDSVLLGGLQNFKLEVSDIDVHLKHAGGCSVTFQIWSRNCPSCWMHLVLPEKALQDFKEGLSTKLVSFQQGKSLTEYGLNVPKDQVLVYEWVSFILLLLVVFHQLSTTLFKTHPSWLSLSQLLSDLWARLVLPGRGGQTGRQSRRHHEAGSHAGVPASFPRFRVQRSTRTNNAFMLFKGHYCRTINAQFGFPTLERVCVYIFLFFQTSKYCTLNL